MAGKKRLEGVHSSAVASVYGLGGLIPTYLQFVQLWLNIDSALSRKGFYTAVASLTTTGTTIPDGWIIEAILDPAEATKWKHYELKRTIRR